MGLAEAFSRLLRPERHPVMELLEWWPTTVDDVLAVPSQHPEDDVAGPQREPAPAAPTRRTTT